MSKILLSQEVKRVQNELRRLSSLLRKPNKFKMTLSKEGADTTATLEKWVQDNIDLMGSFKEDDVDGNLDVNKSVIANLSVAVSNITAILDREKTYATQADLAQALADAKGYTDTEVAKNTKEINTIKSAGIHIPHFANNGERNQAIPNPVEGAVAYVGVNGDWTLTTYVGNNWEDGTKSNHSTTGEDPNKADLDLANVNVGQAITDKIIKIVNGKITYVDEAVTDLTPYRTSKDQDVIDEKKAEKTEVFLKTDYEEKEITITPAVYGWKEIKDLWTNDPTQPFLKYIENNIRMTCFNGIETYVLYPINYLGLIPKKIEEIRFTYELESIFIKDDSPNKAFDNNNSEWQPITKMEIWDIITPAVKAIVLVKK